MSKPTIVPGDLRDEFADEIAFDGARLLPSGMSSLSGGNSLDVTNSMRRTIAFRVAAGGKVAAIPTIEEFLGDSDPVVRRAVIDGIEVALEEGSERDYGKVILGPLIAYLDTACEADAWIDVCRLLLRCDRERAIRELTGPRVLSVANPSLADILAALNEARAPIPMSSAGPILEAAIRHATKDPDSRPDRDEVLSRIGRMRSIRDAGPDVDSDEVIDALASAVADLAGAGDADRFVVARARDSGRRSLTPAQQVVLDAFSFEAGLRGSGVGAFVRDYVAPHARFDFLDGSRSILESLRELRHPAAIELLERALEIAAPAIQTCDCDDDDEPPPPIDIETIESECGSLTRRFLDSAARFSAARRLFAARWAAEMQPGSGKQRARS